MRMLTILLPEGTCRRRPWPVVPSDPATPWMGVSHGQTACEPASRWGGGVLTRNLHSIGDPLSTPLKQEGLQVAETSFCDMCGPNMRWRLPMSEDANHERRCISELKKWGMPYWQRKSCRGRRCWRCPQGGLGHGQTACEPAGVVNYEVSCDWRFQPPIPC